MASFCFHSNSNSKQLWMTAFSISTAKIWINPQFKGAELYVKRAVEKVSAIKKNIKHNKKILCFSMHRNKKE
jgi:hypothetical protein